METTEEGGSGKIKYSDLFSKSLNNGLEGLINRVKEVESTLIEMLKNVKTEAEKAGKALQSGGDVSALSAQIDRLTKQYEEQCKALENVKKTKKKLQETTNEETNTNEENNASIQQITDSIKAYKKEMKDLKKSLEEMSEEERKSSAEAAQMSARVKELDGVIKGFEKSLKSTSAATKAASIENKKQQTTINDLSVAYSSLGDLIQKTGVNVNQLDISQKGANQAVKNGEIVANTAKGSYNQLYAQYNLCKIALNAMGAEMRNDIQIGGVWEKKSLDIMNTMKRMQEATGKHTLSVGEYGKAVNGLQLSFNQITRELPSLTNSMSQFAMAISNNIPIFTDAIKRYSDAHKEAKAQLAEFVKQGMTTEQAMAAMGESAEFLKSTFKGVMATFKSFAGWIGIISAVIPFVTKLIEKKRKAQKEDNDTIEEAITLTKLLADAEKDANREIVNMTNELNVMYSISQDNNRSMEDRLDAGLRLKDMFKDELANYSAEEIALGKAKGAVDELTNSLVAQAQARAYLAEIGDLSVKLYELETTQAKNQETIDAINESVDKSKKKLDEYTESVFQASWTEDARLAIKKEIKDQEKDLEKAKETYDETAKQIEDVNKAIEDLKDRIDPNAFAKTIKDGGKAIKEETGKIPDFYYDMLESTFNLMEDGVNKELALYDLKYEKEKNQREQALSELRIKLMNANTEERGELQTQFDWLVNLIENEEKAYAQGREEIIQKHMETADAIVEEEEDNEEKIRKDAQIRLKSDLQVRNAAIYEAYDEQKISKAELDRELRDSERQYWEEYLAELKENGALTIEEYNNIMSKLTKADENDNKKRRRKRKFRNIVEVGFAYSGTFGEKDKENGGRKVKDEYLEFADSVNYALEKSMDYMDEWMDKRIEMADVAIEQAKREAEIAKEQLDYEQEARANGYANNVEMARKEYEEQLALQRKAEKEKEKLQKAQELIDTATQLSSLVTAVAEIWSAYGGIPVAGPIIAAAVTATMFGAFAAAKIQAAKVASAKTYGEGMVEYLDYGGSHASGNDIDFGVDKKGRHRRVERGEMIGVINKRNVDKYGVSTISGIFNSLNKGTYKSDVVDSVNTAMLSDMYGMSFIHDGVTDLSILEQGVQKLVAQNETKVVAIPNGRIEYKGNSKRIIYAA